MRQKSVATSKFEFGKFSRAVLKFLAGNVSEGVHPSFAIVKVSAPGGVPEYGPESGRSNFLKELKGGAQLFFPFSSSNVDGEPIQCADGKDRQLDDDAEPLLGEVDCVGYLFRLDGDRFVINLAVHAGGCCPGSSPSVDITNCGVFEKGMKGFLKKFVIA